MSELSEAQEKALRAVAKAAEKNADSAGRVCRAAIPKPPALQTLESLAAAGYLVIEDIGGADVWLKLTGKE